MQTTARKSYKTKYHHRIEKPSRKICSSCYADGRVVNMRSECLHCGSTKFTFIEQGETRMAIQNSVQLATGNEALVTTKNWAGTIYNNLTIPEGFNIDLAKQAAFEKANLCLSHNIAMEQVYIIMSGKAGVSTKNKPYDSSKYYLYVKTDVILSKAAHFIGNDKIHWGKPEFLSDEEKEKAGLLICRGCGGKGSNDWGKCKPCKGVGRFKPEEVYYIRIALNNVETAERLHKIGITYEPTYGYGVGFKHESPPANRPDFWRALKRAKRDAAKAHCGIDWTLSPGGGFTDDPDVFDEPDLYHQYLIDAQESYGVEEKRADGVMKYVYSTTNNVQQYMVSGCLEYLRIITEAYQSKDNTWVVPDEIKEAVEVGKDTILLDKNGKVEASGVIKEFILSKYNQTILEGV